MNRSDLTDPTQGAANGNVACYILVFPSWTPFVQEVEDVVVAHAVSNKDDPGVVVDLVGVLDQVAQVLQEVHFV